MLVIITPVFRRII